eukprot:10559740-Ditylum_brightwellii.AAC.1
MHISSDFNIIQEIKVTQKDLHGIKASWVKAHQDDKKSGAELLLDTKLNIMADADVNAFCVNSSTHLSPSTTPTVFPSLKAYITDNGCTIISKLQQWLHNNYTISDMYDYIRTKTSLTIDEMNMNDWDSLGCVLECQHLHNK